MSAVCLLNKLLSCSQELKNSYQRIWSAQIKKGPLFNFPTVDINHSRLLFQVHGPWWFLQSPQKEWKKRVIHKVFQCRYASSVPVLLWALGPEAVLALGVVLGYLYTTGKCSTGNKWPLKLGDLLSLCEKTLRAQRVKLKLSTKFAWWDAPFSGLLLNRMGIKCNTGTLNPVLGDWGPVTH